MSEEFIAPVKQITKEELERDYSPCKFQKGDTEPCDICPRRITALHMCGILQDTIDE